ncbi:MAG: nucleotidyl transferase AbiEii/AbiGii toxin family protein [Mycobacteriaceae bacterium]
MSYSGMPTTVRSLEQRIRNVEGDDGLAQRRRIAMALVVTGQMLPEGTIKGGSAMALRYGRETPKPVAIMRSDHQIAQKLHAATEQGSERAHDLVDLQLLVRGEDLDLNQVAATCARLFEYRRQQHWPPTLEAGKHWDALYAEAADGLGVLPTVDDAVARTNEFIQRIAAVGD